MHLLHENVGVTLDKVPEVDLVAATLQSNDVHLVPEHVLPVLQGELWQHIKNRVDLAGLDPILLHHVVEADEVGDASRQHAT